jgi:hypothetical protein
MTDWPHITVQVVEQHGLVSADVVIMGEYEMDDVLNSLLIAAAQLGSHLELSDHELVERLARYEASIVLKH